MYAANIRSVGYKDINQKQYIYIYFILHFIYLFIYPLFHGVLHMKQK